MDGRSTLGSFHGTSVPQLPLITPTRKSRSPGKSSSKSPSKARVPSPTKSVATCTSSSTRGITKKEQLAQMSPDVTFSDISYIKDPSTPKPVLQLWTHYVMPAKTENRIVPQELKASHPWRSIELFAKAASLGTAKDQADKYRGKAQEAQWVSEVAGRLITDLPTLSACTLAGKRKIETLNISAVSIAPNELCPTSPVDAFTDGNKKIDHALALETSVGEERTLSTGGTVYRVLGPASINQTYGWTAFNPMFANFEAKTNERDLLIQLGTWIAAEYEKRHREGYPMDIPVPAIAIQSDQWKFWIAYSIMVPAKERKHGRKPYRVQFVGPVDMGNTWSIEGVFKILHVLKAVVRWGFNVYEPEYFDKVLAKYEKK
ncbi:MAG: hypothetical protein Q9179_005990 [Wetmoreana sp. 5 TL-2023]